MHKFRVVLAAGLLLLGATGCGDDDKGDSATDTETARATKIDLTATDYAFAVPATIKGGTVEISYKNNGKEPHFAAFAKASDGKTFADVKAALTAPRNVPASGPPPFEEWAAAPGLDPGGSGNLSFDLPAGTYAVFCTIPAADGVPHAAKGMVAEVTVTPGEPVALPEAAGTISAEDFSLSAPPELEAGENVVKLENNGKQLHEINLVELPAGKAVSDVVKFHTSPPTGPPSFKSLTGVAVAPGQQGTATFDLKAGTTYAFVCVIPDTLGDFKPHIAKGMATKTFTV